MKESDIQTLFTKYIKKNRPDGSRVYELKLCKQKSIPFNAVKSHQVENLVNAASSQGLFHKIDDSPVFRGMKTRFHIKKPFDCFFISRAKAYIAVCFYKLRKPKKLLLINVFEWNRYKGISKRKSLTEAAAIGLAEEIITL